VMVAELSVIWIPQSHGQAMIWWVKEFTSRKWSQISRPGAPTQSRTFSRWPAGSWANSESNTESGVVTESPVIKGGP